MGKRQTRVRRKDILIHLQELQQQPFVQVVLRANTVYQGKIIKLSADKLELQDRRSILHIVPLEKIDEIIYDKEAAF